MTNKENKKTIEFLIDKKELKTSDRTDELKKIFRGPKTTPVTSLMEYLDERIKEIRSDFQMLPICKKGLTNEKLIIYLEIYIKVLKLFGGLNDK